MIRAFESSDMDEVLDIWLQASIRAHSFVDKEFWASQAGAMRDKYIPASETYVFIQNKVIKGFFSLYGDFLAAMFVAPQDQGQGIGRQLMDKAKSLRKNLYLTVYRENQKSLKFYRKNGFIPVREQADQHTGQLEILLEYSS